MSSWKRYGIAARFALIEQARNRFALGLLLIFVPIWDWLFGALISNDPVAFKLQSTGAFLQVNGHNLTVLTSGFNAITLIVAFMIFTVTRRNSAFDRRLALAGLPQPVAVAAKTTAIIVVSALVSLYATLVMEIFWRPQSLGAIWLGYLLDALIYGALGLLLGVLVSSELAGFFLIIMVSLMDTLLQAPVENPLANKDFLAVFPSFGPMQVAVGGGFGHGVPGGSVLLALAWFVAFALVGLLIFWWKTRIWSIQAAPSRTETQSTQALSATAPNALQ
jgi:ABC-2 type transport system permease protein